MTTAPVQPTTSPTGAAPAADTQAPPGVDVAALESALRARVDGEVRLDAGTRAVYAVDSGNYRHVPLAVVVPRSVDAGAAAVQVCHELGVPVTSRGGGTSLAGQTVATGVVIDWSKYCHALVSVDPQARTCVVEPGIVLDELNRALRQHGLMFGPSPATHAQCTLGGMIGNNSCGATAQRFGKTEDNLRRLEVLTHDGARFWVGPTSDEEYAEIVRAGGRRAEIYRALRELRDGSLELLRTGFPDIPRLVSGYPLHELLPEKGFDLARALVGTEGTCVTVLHAELDLVPVPKHQSLVALAYDDQATAAGDVPIISPHDPLLLEGMDAKIVRFEKEKRGEQFNLLPPGNAWLLVKTTGESQEESDERARQVLADVQEHGQSRDGRMYEDQREATEIWSIREAALGAAARTPSGKPAWAGWEDTAVPPDRLGDYLRDFQALLTRYGFEQDCALYGHFGHGCLHVRIPFDLVSPSGIDAFRRFSDEVADLVSSYGGSLSGEHGDGRSRSPFLERMYGADMVRLFARFKGVWDPEDRMNPGVGADPAPVDADLRFGANWSPADPATAFRYPEDDGSFQKAVLRCVGVGRCRGHEGTVMCPSYQVTGEEEQSTRGRARLLFEMLQGHPDSPIKEGWRSTAVRDGLDLCLSCKGCKHDCPVEVDMATYKAEFLHHHYKNRLRPASHYSMGWLPVAAQVAARAPGLVNAVTGSRALHGPLTRLAGVDEHRQLPRFAKQTLRSWFAGRGGSKGTGQRGPVLLWPDTFTNSLSPEVGRAAVEVLEDAGYEVALPDKALCCGLTWISTGQLGVAKRVLRRTVRALAPHLSQGLPVVGLEPSCTAVFRSDAHDMFPHDRDVARLRAQTVTLAELLHDRTPGWEPPRLDGRRAVVQRHCHQYAVLGFDADHDVLRSTGLDVDVLEPSCCGLAGNFGFERGHYEVSMAIAERVLLPAARSADEDTLVLADGFSCRTQVEQSDVQRRPLHLAEVLRMGSRDGSAGG